MLTLMYYFYYHRYVNLDSHDKNALVSLSLTDEPTAVDIVRHSSRDKVVCSFMDCFLTLQYFQRTEPIEHYQLCIECANHPSGLRCKKGYCI